MAYNWQEMLARGAPTVVPTEQIRGKVDNFIKTARYRAKKAGYVVVAQETEDGVMMTFSVKES